MLSLLILAGTAVMIWLIYRSIQKAMREWRQTTPSRPQIIIPQTAGRQAKRTWQVHTLQLDYEAHISVEHPIEGVWHTWKINLSDPHAQQEIDKAIQAADKLADHLSQS